MESWNFDDSIEDLARRRALVLLAVTDIVQQRDLGNLKYFASDPENQIIGPTCLEIRNWIHKRKDILLENVPNRCGELLVNTESSTGKPFLRKEQDRFYPYEFRPHKPGGS